MARFVIGILCSAAVYIVLGRFQQNSIRKWKEQADKNRSLFLIMSQWVRIYQEGHRLEEYFLKNHYRRIAVYGMGDLGKRFVKEFAASDVQIAYAIDCNAKHILSDVKLITPDDEMESVDAIVITVTSGFREIQKQLFLKANCAIIAIEDVLNAI